MRINKGLFGFRMRNKILRRSENIETRSKKHDFSDRNSPVYLTQDYLQSVYRTPVHVQCCFIITQKLLLEASKTNTSFSRLSASSSYVSLDLQQDNMHLLRPCFSAFITKIKTAIRGKSNKHIYIVFKPHYM